MLKKYCFSHMLGSFKSDFFPEAHSNTNIDNNARTGEKNEVS